MAEDLIDFWSKMKGPDSVHPSDAEVFRRLGDEKHAFDLTCLPACFCGDIRSAPVVLLYLSPGLSKPDHADAQSAAGRARYEEMRAGRSLLPSQEEHETVWRWWTSRTQCFGDWGRIRPHLALLNIGAYHSKDFSDWQMLASLPSSRASLSWAQDVLFPQAEAGERVVICLRGARFWGLSRGRHGVSLFAPSTTRGGHMKKGSLRDEVVRAVTGRLKREGVQ